MLQQIRYSLRMLFKYRMYTAFALIGLSIAMASAWFIGDYVHTFYQYDAFHSKQDRIYRLSMEITAGGSTDHYASTGKPLGALLSENYTGIESYASLAFQEDMVRVEEEVFKASGLFKANPAALAVFSFDFIKGGGEASLAEPNSVLLSKSLARKFYGDIDVLGKALSLGDKTYAVRGVFQDWPAHSHLEVNALFSKEPAAEYDAQSWFDIEQYTYVLLDQGRSPDDLNDQLDALLRQELMPMIEGAGVEVQFRSQALRKVYASPGLVDDVKKGNVIYAKALAIAGILILLIAALNFINLMLTRSAQRSKEITLKKIFGMNAQQLRRQSIIETLLMSFLVLFFTSLLILFGEGFYLDFTGFSSLGAEANWVLLPGFVLLVFVLGLLGTSYSGVYYSLSDNSRMLKGLGFTWFKKLLLGTQYGLAAIILIFALTMERQLNYVHNKDLGFAKEGILLVDLPEDNPSNERSLPFREQIKAMASVQSASLVGGGALPGEENGKDLFEVKLEGSTAEKIYNIYRIDEAYFELLDIKLSKGRNFTADKSSDRTSAVIINEALANSLNWQEPIGQIINYGGEEREVVGLVKNFHNKSLHNIIEPIVFLYEPQGARKLLIKTSLSNLGAIQSSWAQFYPTLPFSPSYFDEFIAAMYTQEAQLMRVFRFFAFIALLLCSTGLFALFSLHVLQRTKEMSIRKVLGAKAGQLLQAITKSYTWVALISIFLALPLAWFAVRKWLTEFSYRVPLGWDIFLLAGVLLLLISFLVIAYHIAKVLKVDPAVELKR